MPPAFQREVEDVINFLLEKSLKKPRGKPNFAWAGSLEDLREKYTSVELECAENKRLSKEQRRRANSGKSARLWQ
ncbi:MAG: DUF2281 domain-containing protein [Candidatus Lindowbacteria bacterium]|nr:DUF2281 domain-containing protein [Candidatus Lindowbacteria bacterium]